MYKDGNVRRAERAGFKAIATLAIVLTVDTPRLGHKEADKKSRCAYFFPTLLQEAYI